MIIKLLKLFWKFVEDYFATQHEVVPPAHVVPQEQPVVTVTVEPANKPPKYLWDTKENIRHSIRVICDEEGLSIKDKNDLCATIYCESAGFNTKAINENKVNGKVVSTDWGLCQWNDFYHGEEISPEVALNDPEKAVRLMCHYWKSGLKRQWVCYSKGLYKSYLNK